MLAGTDGSTLLGAIAGFGALLLVFLLYVKKRWWWNTVGGISSCCDDACPPVSSRPVPSPPVPSPSTSHKQKFGKYPIIKIKKTFFSIR